MAVIPLAEVQSSRTQRPSAGASYPYVDLTVGDLNTQRLVQLQLEQVLGKHGDGDEDKDAPQKPQLFVLSESRC